MWKKALVKLARLKADPDLKDYGFYHVDRLEQQMGDGGKFYRDIVQMNNAPLTIEGFARYHEYAMRFAQQYYPDAYDGHKAAFERISREIQGSAPSQNQPPAVIKKVLGKKPDFK